MKRRLLLLILLLITIIFFSACQQQVAEVAYDLDSKSILDQTRNTQKAVLFQSSSTPTNPSNTNKIQTFKGIVLKIENTANGQGACLTLSNNAAEELLIEVDMSTQVKIALNMELAIRYAIENEKINLLEIKKIE